MKYFLTRTSLQVRGGRLTDCSRIVSNQVSAVQSQKTLQPKMSCHSRYQKGETAEQRFLSFLIGRLQYIYSLLHGTYP